MPTLHLKDVPDELVEEIRRRAEGEGRTVRDFVLDAVRATLARDAFAARIVRRGPVELPGPAVDALDGVRAERDGDLDP